MFHFVHTRIFADENARCYKLGDNGETVILKPTQNTIEYARKWLNIYGEIFNGIETCNCLARVQTPYAFTKIPKGKSYSVERHSNYLLIKTGNVAHGDHAEEVLAKACYELFCLNAPQLTNNMAAVYFEIEVMLVNIEPCYKRSKDDKKYGRHCCRSLFIPDGKKFFIDGSPITLGFTSTNKNSLVIFGLTQTECGEKSGAYSNHSGQMMYDDPYRPGTYLQPLGI